MVEQELTSREKFVLTSIIENFVSCASPVGSRLIERECRAEISSATIRNVMSNLEERGFIAQPHTSAGRLPTDKGYRFYVDSLMHVENLNADEQKKIFEQIVSVSKEVETVLDAASRTLASISNQLGIAMAPRFYQGIFDRIELIPIAYKKVLAILSIKSGLVKTITMELDEDVKRDHLDDVAQIINERLHGLTLREIKQTIDERLKDVNLSNSSFLDLVIKSSSRFFSFSSSSDLHLGGTAKIMTLPEFKSETSLQKIMELLDDKEILVHLINDDDQSADYFPQDKIKIMIGEENRDELLSNCSLITTTYNFGQISGTIGIMGPTRMRYSKIIAVVDYMSKVLTEMFKQNDA